MQQLLSVVPLLVVQQAPPVAAQLPVVQQLLSEVPLPLSVVPLPVVWVSKWAHTFRPV